MRRLDEITITSDDRPAPPTTTRRRAPKTPRAVQPAASKAIAALAPPQAAAKPVHRKRIAPAWWRRGRPAILTASILAGCALFMTVAVKTGIGPRLVHAVGGYMVSLTGKAGLTVSDIAIDGATRTTRDAVLTALQTRPGDPILGLDLVAMRDRLETISWVKTATLERRMPGQIHVLLTERAPIAIWQNQGKYMLVDGQGQPISPDVGQYRDTLPLVVGEGAPAHAAALLSMLAEEPALQARVKAAQWVGDRRWNIEFDQPSGGIEVQLPEDAPDTAWRGLAQLDHDHQILERKLSVIDLRLPDRYVLRPTPPAPPPSAPSAKAKRKGGREA